MSALGNLFSDIAGAIREKTGETGTMKPAQFPEKILGIQGGGSADVRYVTFMSYDGTVEYGKKAVAVGDDCADPIKRGVFGTPTRESTAQYNYTFAGWATEINGGLNSDALKAVAEDRTVYANFAAVVRYYTVTFYDGDTVLKTESKAYGSTLSSYKPEKYGYSFIRWQPSLTTVTGDAEYHAVWEEAVTFANGSWAQIAEIAEAGNAADYFKIGDTRDIQVNMGGTIPTTVTIRIVAFNTDPLADAEGTAGITCVTTNALGYQAHDARATSVSKEYSWDLCQLRTYCNGTLYNGIESNLKGIIKKVKKYSATKSSYVETKDLCWPLGAREVNSGKGPTQAPIYSAEFPDATSRKKGNKVWNLRDTNGPQMNYFVIQDGSVTANTGQKTERPFVFGFCI